MQTLLLSMRILAAIHSGIIQNKCSTCSPDTAEELNCTLQDSDVTVYMLDGEIELCSCPIKLISDEALSYYDQYNYTKLFPSAPVPSYSDVSFRFLEAIKSYDYWYNTYQIQELDNKNGSKANSSKTTDNNLSKLRNQFLDNKK